MSSIKNAVGSNDMQPQSKTTEDWPNRCLICGHAVRFEPSENACDATCLYCGCLLWFNRSGGLSADKSLADESDIARTRGQIERLIAEIAQLSRSNITDGEFYDGFLPRVVAALAALGGAVWTLGHGDRLMLRKEIGFENVGLQKPLEQQPPHRQLLYEILDGDRGALVLPRATFGANEAASDEVIAANPTDVLLILGLLKAGHRTVGLVEILQRTESPPTVQQAYLRFLEQMCDLASDFLGAWRDPD
jgi:hypothetical protein